MWTKALVVKQWKVLGKKKKKKEKHPFKYTAVFPGTLGEFQGRGNKEASHEGMALREGPLSGACSSGTHTDSGWAPGFCARGQGAAVAVAGFGAWTRESRSSGSAAWSLPGTQDPSCVTPAGGPPGKTAISLGLPRLPVPPGNSLGPEGRAVSAAGSHSPAAVSGLPIISRQDRSPWGTALPPPPPAEPPSGASNLGGQNLCVWAGVFPL